MEIYMWYECSRCHNQGYTKGIPDSKFNGGCYPDGPRGNHKWKEIGEFETDLNEYPEERYDISE